MAVYITIGDLNRVTGFYNENNVVEGAIEITADIQAAILEYYPNVSYVDGVVAYLDYYSTIELDAMKVIKMAEINSKFESAFLTIRDDTPPSEVNTWVKQEAEARSWVTDSTVSTPFVDTIAEVRGIDREVLLEKIIAKSDIYALAAARLTGLRQKFEDAVDAATTNAEVTAIEVIYD